MKKCLLSEKFDKPIALALGFFDCIHTGHKRLVERAIECKGADDRLCSALFTFSNDPNIRLSHRKQIYTFDERAHVLERLGLDVLLHAEFSTDFCNMSKDEFLVMLVTNFNVKYIICGADYTFGRGAEGDVEYLQRFCDNNEILLIVEPYEMAFGEKLSTRDLKKLVAEGNVKELNLYLSEPYFMLGEVVHSRNFGEKIGFPTANIDICENKLPLSFGIYATLCEVDGKIYPSMTNVGAKPTVNDQSCSVETHIFNFDRDIYGKKIKVSFLQKTRNVVKFDSVDALVAQLTKDKIEIENITEEYLAGEI